MGLEGCERARGEAWDKAEDVTDRISRLKKVAAEFPKNMIPLADIAESYLEAGDVDNTTKTYQQIIDQKETFETAWAGEFGKAYLFTGDVDKAIEVLETSGAISWDIGLFRAFARLKSGNAEAFKTNFDLWISENLERSWEQCRYQDYIEALFDEEEKKLTERVWGRYYDKYTAMEPYQLYCEVYKQYSKRIGKAAIDDEDFEILPKLTKAKFDGLSGEYLYFEKQCMFGEPSEADYKSFQELEYLLFADIVWS